MSDFTHLVFTRINTNYPGSDSEYPNNLLEAVKKKQFSTRWLRDRIHHMKVMTAPSIKAQSSTNFFWIILMHSDTDPEIVAEFRKFAEGYKRFSVELTDQAPRTFVPEYIKKKVKTPWVMTTTLDSDDAFSDNYIKAIQERFDSKREYLNITIGYKFVPNGFTDRIFGVSSQASPYLTFVEPTDRARGVYCMIHSGAHFVAPVRQIVEENVAWLQLIHGDNLMSRAKWRRAHKGRKIDRLKRRGLNFSVDYEGVRFKT